MGNFKSLRFGQRVQVYRNIRKNMFSIIDKKSKRLIIHCNSILLSSVEFKVSAKGRERVLREKQKRIHAYVEGDFVRCEVNNIISNVSKVYYNPYFTENFINTETGQSIFNAKKCYLIQGECFI
ncbi:hypothetical protein [Metabacillus arenae]